MRLGEQCPFITPCGFCSRQLKQCDYHCNKKNPPEFLKKTMNIVKDYEKRMEIMEQEAKQ